MRWPLAFRSRFFLASLWRGCHFYNGNPSLDSGAEHDLTSEALAPNRDLHRQVVLRLRAQAQAQGKRVRRCVPHSYQRAL